jgi:large subunit ribosomal protein L18
MIGVDKNEKRSRRKRTIRLKVVGSTERPRLSVYRSLNHIYAQVVDDTRGTTLAAASSLSEEIKGAPKGKGKISVAQKVGELVAKNCLSKKIEQVVFDRNGFEYHGRVAAVAKGARDGGLKF